MVSVDQAYMVGHMKNADGSINNKNVVLSAACEAAELFQCMMSVNQKLEDWQRFNHTLEMHLRSVECEKIHDICQALYGMKHPSDELEGLYLARLPVHVRVIADEFANIGQIPQFDKLIATIRSREISASIILQSQSQLKAMYKDSADTILGNCDTTLFLGGKEKTTLKEMSELLGKETIDLYNTSETRSNQKSFGLNYQKTGKQLMTEDEIAVMDGGKCILQIRGARPFFSDKYDITKHKNYRFLADENEKNRYKVEKELNPQYTPKPEEEVEVIQVELSE